MQFFSTESSMGAFPAPPAGQKPSTLDLLLTSGGDDRIFVDPVTGRNRYGTTPAPAADEVFFSSSTATTINPCAYRAVGEAWAAADPARLDAWFDDIRARIADLFGIAGCRVVLTGSGTQAELVGVAIAKAVLHGPLTNIVLAPAETGSGVVKAASGAHFLDSTPFGPERRAGTPLHGWADADIRAETVEIRDPDGELLSPVEVEGRVRRKVAQAMTDGRNVLLHLLDASKTGCSGPTLDAAAEIAAEAPERIVVFADCCQLRCSRERIRQLLRSGFMVAITGSKFFGGPPFSGALLLPPALLSRVKAWALPEGLADHSSRQDWSRDLAARIAMRWRSEANVGLGLRWIAALSEMERFFAVPEAPRAVVLARLEHEILARSQSVRHLQELSDAAHAQTRATRSILPFVMMHPGGAPFSAIETAAVHASLRQPEGGRESGRRRGFHLGQPVAVGRRTALRVCVSAPDISEIAEGVAGADGLELKFHAWRERLDALFDKWAALMEETSRVRKTAAEPSRI